jgi:beta-lactamase regulating signal transducer with metallopeptidase domain
MDKIFLIVLNMSLTASFVIAAILLARLFLRRAPKVISYALWAVALFNLLCPIKPEGVFSLIPFDNRPIQIPIRSDPAASSVIGDNVSFVSALDAAYHAVGDALNGGLGTVTVYTDSAPEGFRQAYHSEIWVIFGSYLWSAGAAFLLLFAVIGYIRLKNRVSLAVRVEDDIYETDRIDSPFVLGLFRPRVYIPTGMDATLTTFIVKHELTHIRRRDYLVSVMVFAALALHWFNPLVWVAYMFMMRDMESSCDEAVLRGSSEDIRREYSSALLSFSRGRTQLSFPLAFGEQSVKERVKNVLNFKKPSRVIIAAAVALAAVLSVGFAVNRVSGNIDENKLLTRLGYTKKSVSSIIDNRTAYLAGNEHIVSIVKTLPVQSDRRYDSFSMENDREINIAYMYDYDNPYLGGNGLDPFPETVRENNALLLFASISSLEKVNYLHYDDSRELDHVDSYTMEELTARFGKITPENMSFTEIYSALAANIQISEFYFAHYSRIYLGADFEEVSYRNGDADEIIQQADGSVIWIYSSLGESYKLLPSGEWETDIPGYTEIYFFNSPLSEKNDSLTGLYAKIGYENYGETYEGLTVYLGEPDITKDIGGGNKYIAYHLREGQRKNAYFVLQSDKITAEGIMYGDDYTSLQIGGEFPKPVKIDHKAIETTPPDEKNFDISQRVEDGLRIIMSSPIYSSNPQDYIDEHRQEYENLTAKYPEGVLEYLLSQFEAGDADGLRGHIMMRMCKDMLGPRNNVTDESLPPSEWYRQLSIIDEIELPDFIPGNPEGDYSELIYSAITRNYSSPDEGFLVAAPTVYGAYEEDDKLKIFVTVFYERYKLYGKTLERTGGAVIPGAIIFAEEYAGGWAFEEYLEVGRGELPDGAYFNDSVRKLCVMPVSGTEIKGLAEKMNSDYTDAHRHELLTQNLIEHLKTQRQTGVSLKNPDGNLVKLT